MMRLANILRALSTWLGRLAYKIEYRYDKTEDKK